MLMGTIHVAVLLRDMRNQRKRYEADFRIDTRAMNSTAPASQLRRAGIRPAGRMVYELADGSAVEYDFGLAAIEFMGDVTAGRVIFGPKNAEPILGVTALESVGLVVDPGLNR